MLYVTQDARIKEILEEIRDPYHISDKVLIEAPITRDFKQRLKKKRGLLMSTKSRLAQRGIEVLSLQGYGYPPFKLTSDDTIEEIVSIDHWAGEVVRLEVGDPVGRFYLRGDIILRKHELEALIESRELDLGNNYEIVAEFGLIEIKPRNVKFVPHPDQPEVLTMADLENNTYPLQRLEVDSLSLGPGEFVATETEPISLPKDVYGEVIPSSERGEPIHLWSSLIDPGFNECLRLEFRSCSYETRIIPYAFLMLYRDRK